MKSIEQLIAEQERELMAAKKRAAEMLAGIFADRCQQHLDRACEAARELGRLEALSGKASQEAAKSEAKANFPPRKIEFPRAKGLNA